MAYFTQHIIKSRTGIDSGCDKAQFDGKTLVRAIEKEKQFKFRAGSIVTNFISIK